MTTQETFKGTPSADQKTLRKVTVAGSVGVFVEFFDYGIYGFLASTIAHVFFPAADPTAGLLLTFVAFGLPFFVRPLGGVIWGYLGDKIGRQRVLVYILTLITVATTAIGLLPSYATIGILAPILLFACRLAQGFSAGGESAGAMSFVAEYAPEGRRGRLTSWAQLASYGSLLAATLVGTALAETLTTEQLQSWGWRIPFLLALPFGGIGLYIRTKLEDSPEFKKMKSASGTAKNPLREALASPEHRRAILLAITIPVLNGSGYYVLFTYMPTYLNKTLNFSISAGFAVTGCALLVVMTAIPLAGRLSDRLGRKKVMIGSAVSVIVLGLPCYWLMTLGSIPVAILGAGLLALPFAGHTGVVHVLLVELFPTRLRYTAYSFGYNISTAVFGGAAPLLLTYLIAETGNNAVPAIYMVLTALITAIAVGTAKETAHTPLVER
ncbi:MFS transporter [Rhodococcus sp. WS4]|nr:MFS transporter [Rhodococcus sp. WS4]